MSMLTRPLALALAQLNDRAFVRVLLHSLLASAACFAAILAGTIWAMHRLLALHGWWSWAVDLLGGVGAALLAFWLFLPVAAAIGAMFIETIARAVERRHYPALAAARGASVAAQAWDGIAVGLRILGLNVLALLPALLLPGIGLLLAWAIGAFAIGRGLFVAVAMRRMSRPEAEMLYRSNRVLILTQGGIMTLASYLPVLNLLIPLIGTAAMVHVLDLALTRSRG
jgi:CysZ protein